VVKVELIFDPFDLAVIEVRSNNRPMGYAVPCSSSRNRGTRLDAAKCGACGSESANTVRTSPSSNERNPEVQEVGKRYI